jgi:hypothetical protein
MTIQVTVTNNDAARSIEIFEVEITKNRSARDGRTVPEVKDGFPVRVGPGKTSTHHVFLLRDLLIREVHPSDE